MTNETLVFSFSPYECLVPKWFAGSLCVLASFSLKRFANKEIQLALHANVTNRSCLIIGSLAPPELHLLSFLALSHTLKKEGAKKVTACIPYLAYSRQENDESQKSQIAALLGKLLKASGIDEVYTVDVHSPRIKALFPLPIYSLSCASLFAKQLKCLPWDSYSFVAPDQGAIERCQEVASLVNGSREIVWVSKTRHARGVSHSSISGKIQKRVVIIDDILDTGQTLISCCKKLKGEGAREIIVMVTHGLFSGSAWNKLWELGVKKIYCTDTIPLPKTVSKEGRIVVLPITTIGGGEWKR